MREPGPFSPPIKGNDHVELSSSLAAFCPFVLVPVLRGVQRQFSQERADLAHFVFKIGGAPGESLVTLAGAIFIAPYFILSALGGQIADKFDKALVAQRRALAPREADDPAVILFTSGSEGAPKGVVLSHKNMLANVANPGVLQPPQEGWHDTGDIVSIDEQGFTTIKGRAKTFRQNRR